MADGECLEAGSLEEAFCILNAELNAQRTALAMFLVTLDKAECLDMGAFADALDKLKFPDGEELSTARMHALAEYFRSFMALPPTLKLIEGGRVEDGA